ncbi:hypothetical protein P9112_012687 [Eukaryota sp. TZLM1-RC]
MILSEDSYTPTFYTEGSYQFVDPYPFVFKARVRESWVNRTLFDVVCEQFGGIRSKLSSSDIEQRINTGDITVNNEVKSINYLLTLKDTIVSKVVRVENGILKIPYIILQPQYNSILAVCKPPSVPLASNGPYRYNTLGYTLAKDFPNTKLFPTHRLDSVTSGTVVYATDSAMARRISLAHTNHSIRKVYIARVRGRLSFENIVVINDPIGQDTQHAGIRMGVFSEGKESCSLVVPLVSGLKGIDSRELTRQPDLYFDCRDYDCVDDKIDSLVAVIPKTGRKHQIRVHLSHFGIPIVGDILYNNEEVFKELFSDDKQVAAPPCCLHSYHYSEANGLFSFTSTLPFWARECQSAVEGLNIEELNNFG